MLSFFNNTNDNSSEVSDNSSEESIDLDFDETFVPEFQLGDVSYCKTDAKTLVENIKLWPYNRELNNARVNQMAKAMKSGQKIYGDFHTCCCNGKYMLIDGQHRFKALEKCLEDENFYLEVVMQVHRAENDDQIVNIFKAINNVTLLKPKETPNVVVIKAIEMLKKDFCKNNAKPIRDGNRPYYPYMLESELNKKLLPVVNSRSAEQLYTDIRKANLKYRKLDSEIPGMRPDFENALLKAKKTSFFLGLDEQWNWIDDL